MSLSELTILTLLSYHSISVISNIITNNNQVKRAEKTAQNFGILDVSPARLIVPPTFTEPETLEAMGQLGLTPKDLVLMTREDYEKIPGGDEIREQIIREIDFKRREMITKIISTRNELISGKKKLNKVRIAKNKIPGESVITKTVVKPFTLKKRKHKKLNRDEAALLKLQKDELKQQKRISREAKADSAQAKQRIRRIELERAKKLNEMRKKRIHQINEADKARAKLEKKQQKAAFEALKKNEAALQRVEKIRAERLKLIQEKEAERLKKIKQIQKRKDQMEHEQIIKARRDMRVSERRSKAIKLEKEKKEREVAMRKKRNIPPKLPYLNRM